jgi:hypothetical protein
MAVSLYNTSDAARCTRATASAPTLSRSTTEGAMPTGKKFARQSRAA